MFKSDLPTQLRDGTTEREAPETTGAAAVPAVPQFFTLLRADDLLAVDVRLQGFSLLKTPAQYLLQTAGGGVITLTLPMQHVLEGLGAQPKKPVFGNAPTLSFRVAPNAAPIPLSIDGILAAVAGCEPIVDAALPGAPLVNDSGGTTPDSSSAPLGVFTSTAAQPASQVFLPGRIGLTPRGGAMRWRHAAQAVARNGAVELWHTRLARRTTSGGHVERSEDIVGTTLAFNGLPINGGGSASDPTAPSIPNPNSDWSKATAQVSRLPDLDAVAVINQSRQAPGSLKARQLMLSPLGAWADLRGNWPNAPTIKSWRHEIAMGRDQSQRVAVLGRMYPLGHEATMVTTTQRLLDGVNGRRARLQQRFQITIREELRAFPGSDSAARSFPFRDVELLTTAPPEGSARSISGSAIYLERGPANKKRPLAYRCRGTDKSGRSIHFSMPLIFVPNNFSDFGGLATAYEALVNAPKSDFTARLNSQRVGLATAPAGAASAGSEVVLDLAKLAHVPGSDAGFRPIVREMSGWVPGIEDFGNDARALTMRYAEQFKNSPLEFGDGNLGEVLLQIDAAPVLSLIDSKGVSGMMSELKLAPSGYSRALGPVAGSLAQAALAEFNPADFLGNALGSMKLLGVFPLASLLSTVKGLQNAPRVIARQVNGARSQSFAWSAPLFAGQQKSIDVFTGRLRERPGAKASLDVRGSATVDLQTQQLQASTTCSIGNVEAAIVIAGTELVVVPLESISFQAANGRSPEVKVALGDIGFGGALSYVRKLTKLIDRGGFMGANGIELLPDGVRTRFNLAVPGIGVGMFVLENISFGARFDLPFKDRVPELAVNFSSFENPFRLTVLAIGGCGHVQVGVDLEGKVSLAASLEFGAAVSLNLGVAKASVSIMGGIYFVLQDGDYTITGYLRVNGRAEILGIASVSVELYVGLTYIPQENAVLGEAEIVATVRLLFMKKTFRIPFKKKFGGSNDSVRAALIESRPPGFADAMNPPGWAGVRPWDAYCLAFAD